MLATSLISLVLLGLAGVLLDAHRREWIDANEGSLAPEAYAFARSRYRRRRFATLTIALVGGLIALWPVVPREPLWVLGFAAVLAALALQIFFLGVGDAWSSARFYKVQSRREAGQSVAKLREALRDSAHAHASGSDPSQADAPRADREAIRA